MQRTIYEFGSFQLDADQRVLLQGGRPIPIPPKELDTLLILVENHGRIVDKQRLMEAVWPDVFVEEGNLSRHISYLRNRLGDSASGSQYVETVPKRGYRFVAPVTVRPLELSGAGAAASDDSISPLNGGVMDAPPSAPQAVPTSPSMARPITRHGRVLAGIAFVLLALLLGGTLYSRLFRTQPTPFSQMRLTRLTDSGHVTDATISRDGKYVAYVESDAKGNSLWIKHLTTNSHVQIVPPAPKRYIGITIAPDSDYVYFVLFGVPQVGIGTLYKVPILGGTAVQVLNDVDVAVSFSPDGKQFVFRRDAPALFESRLFVANGDGSGERLLVARRVPVNFVGLPAWTSDSAILCFVLSEGPEAATSIAKIDATTGNVTLSGRSKVANGQLISLSQTAFAAAIVQESTRGRGQIVSLPDLDASFLPITNDLNSYNMHVSATTDGKHLVSVQQSTNTQVWLMPVSNPQAATQITNTQEAFNDVRWTTADQLITKNNSGQLSLRELNGTHRVTVESPLILNFDDDCDHGRYIVYSALPVRAQQGSFGPT